MPQLRRLIPLLVGAMVIQGLVGVLPHTHGCGAIFTEASQATGVVASGGGSLIGHDCLACSLHAPMVDAAADRGVVHGIERASTVPVVRWSISVLSSQQISNPRAPPWIV